MYLLYNIYNACQRLHRQLQPSLMNPHRMVVGVLLFTQTRELYLTSIPDVW